MHFAKRKTGAFFTLGIKSGLPDCNLSVMIVYHVTYFLKSKPRFTTVALVTHSGEGRTGGVYIIYWHASARARPASAASDVTVASQELGLPGFSWVALSLPEEWNVGRKLHLVSKRRGRGLCTHFSETFNNSPGPQGMQKQIAIFIN